MIIKSIYKKLLSERSRNSIRNEINRFTSVIYRGSRFTCNCCGHSFKKFLPKGTSIEQRENAQCPDCGSLERNRLLLFYLERETEVFNKTLKVLHFAPEPCLYKRLSKTEGEYIDGDINPANARHVVDITDIPFPQGYFDLIICSHVLGHIPDEPKAIQELKRVLKPGGEALVLTLINPEAGTFEDKALASESERLKNYGEPDLLRLHGNDFSSRLERQGFKVETIDYRQKFDLDQQEKYRLGNGKRELIFRCTK